MLEMKFYTIDFRNKSAISKNQDVVLLGSHVKHVNREGQEVFTEYVPTTAKGIEKMMHMNSCFPHPSVMFRTCILKDIGFIARNIQSRRITNFSLESLKSLE